MEKRTISDVTAEITVRALRVADADLEPVDGAAVDEGWEHAQSVAEGVADRTEGEDEVEVASHSLNELVVHVHRRKVGGGVLQLSDHLHLLKFGECSWCIFDESAE